MPSISRKTDTGSNHGAWVPSKAIAGSNNVYIDGKPALRRGDALAPHVRPRRAPHPRKVAAGSPTVFVNGRPVARIGDSINCGGKMAQGASSVFADDQ